VCISWTTKKVNSHIYEPSVEFVASRRTAVVLTSYHLSTLSHLPKICENMCKNQAHTYKSLCRLQASVRDSVAKVTIDKQSISLRPNKLNYLLTMISILENHLSRYTLAQSDVMTYVTAATDADVYVQFRPDADTYIVHGQMHDEVKGFM
jgi:hypothetical protein